MKIGIKQIFKILTNKPNCKIYLQKSGKNKEKVRELLFDKGYLCVKEFEIEDGFVLKKYLGNPTLYRT